MSLPLRKVIVFIASIIIFILGCLLVFGIRQYQLQSRIDIVISQSEKMLFQFSSIREHIIESVVINKYDQLDIIIKDVEQLHQNITDIINNKYIPNEYKLSFLNRIDLQGLILLIRQSSLSHPDNNRIQQLNRECRVMNERMIMFDRVIVDFAKSSIIAFQSIIIGSLAIFVFLIVVVLVMLHKYIAIPLLDLVSQVTLVANSKKNDVVLDNRRISIDVYNLCTAFNNLLLTRLIDSAEIARYNRLYLSMINISNAINNSSTRSELFNNIYKSLLLNDDYYFILIHIYDDSNILTIVDDDTISSNNEFYKILSDLSISNDLNNQVNRAINEKTAIVEFDMFSNVPKRQMKNINIVGGKISCAALPILFQNKCYGAISIYSVLEFSFQNDELKLLNKMASDVAFAIAYLDTKNALNSEKVRFELVRSYPDMMNFLLSSDGNFLSCDDNFSKIVEFQPGALLQKNWLDLASYLKSEEEDMFRKFIQSESIYNYQCDVIIRKNENHSGRFRCRMTKNTKLNNGFEVFGLCQDISELDRIKHEVEMNQLVQRLLMDAVSEMIFITSVSGDILEVNEKVIEALKSDKSEIHGKNIFQYIFSDRNAESNSILKKSMLEKKKTTLVQRFDHLASEFLVSIVPLPVNVYKETRLVLIVSHISVGPEQRAEEFVRVFQLTNLGELATGVAHEINNLSNGIINYAQILTDESIEKDCKLDPERLELLKKIIREGERIARIVQKLLFYSQNKGKSKELLRINDVIEDVLLLVKHQLKNDGIRVDLDLSDDLQPVAFESSKLQLVFLCILNNSRRALNEKYSGKNENKHIELKAVMEIRNGKSWIKIMVTDWGIGISPEILPRIFDPVYTMKSLSKESGMGLAVSRQLLMKYHGSISVVSELGNYTTVTIELPAQSGQTA